MTGKELKEFAASVCEDAEIQVQQSSIHTYRSDWDELKPEHIRAIHIVTGKPS